MTGSTKLSRSALRLLEQLAAGPGSNVDGDDVGTLIGSDLAAIDPDGRLVVTDAGLSYLARRASDGGTIDPFRAQHLALTDGSGPEIGIGAKFDESESPLIWLARRKGADGRALIEPHQFQAGERLRADFTHAQMMPRTTSNWHSPVAGRRRDGQTSGHLTERVVAARQRLRHALDTVGPEFSGLLIDVCCFLKKLDAVERERRWPARSAKVVLQLALERLARHYGYRSEAVGRAAAAMRAWADGTCDPVAADG
jgi:hypothetical protein